MSKILLTSIYSFPAYPLLIIGPHAGNLSGIVSQPKALSIIVAGFTVQGTGFLVSLTVYAAFVYRLMTHKLPREPLRPGMFVSVGPSGFTVSGTINMAANLHRALPADFMGNGPMTAQVLKVVGNWMCLWLWGLALWFFLVSLMAHWSCVKGRMHFAMTWYSFIFPNTALITATFAIGKAFNARAIQIVGCVMTIMLICMWFFVVFMMIRAIKHHQILWPQQGEDKDEGGFKAKNLGKSKEDPVLEQTTEKRVEEV